MIANALAKRPQGPPGDDSFYQDVVSGLSAPRKSLNPKYFYDSIGSRLFSMISRLPEYPVTRTETAILTGARAAIAEACNTTRSVVEFGSGSGRRTRLLLSALPRVSAYLPIDVSRDQMEATRQTVRSAFSGIDVIPIRGDFTIPIDLGGAPSPRLGFLPGSTIGNFPPGTAAAVLDGARASLGFGARMLVGVDRVKSTGLLESAYDDAQGVTAAFNLNLLARINRELGGNFDLDGFAHQAFYDPARARIEMHLVSLSDQRVSLRGGPTFRFRAGETIHTESSYKYTPQSFAPVAHHGGWQVKSRWTDDNDLYDLYLLEGQ